MDGDEGKDMVVDEDGSVPVNVHSDARGDVVADELVVAKGVTVDTVVDGDEGKDMVVDEDGSVPVNVRSDACGDVVADELVAAKGVTVDTVVDGDEGKDMVVNVDVSENQTSVNVCTFSSADDINIYKIGHNIRDKFVVTSAAGMRFQASVLSL